MFFLLKDFYPTPCPLKGFPGGAVVKNLPANAGDVGLIPGLERSPGGENDNPLQYSCLGNPMDRGVWWATVSCKESDMTEATKQLLPKTSLTEIAYYLPVKYTVTTIYLFPSAPVVLWS